MLSSCARTSTLCCSSSKTVRGADRYVDLMAASYRDSRPLFIFVKAAQGFLKDFQAIVAWGAASVHPPTRCCPDEPKPDEPIWSNVQQKT